MFQGDVTLSVSLPCGYRATVEDALWCYLIGDLACMGWIVPETFRPRLPGLFLSRLRSAPFTPAA